MSKKHHGGPAPVPPGNQSPAGPGSVGDEPSNAEENAGAGFQEQDPKRRLGDYGGAGEHPRQQPGRLNDGDVHTQ
jgi:hypothetical protein